MVVNPKNNEDTVVVVAGGLGYIGSHVVLSLLKSGRFDRILILDDFSNSKQDRIYEITEAYETSLKHVTATSGEEDNEDKKQKKHDDYSLELKRIDLRNLDETMNVFRRLYEVESAVVEAIINLAGAKSVPESIQKPTLYYDNITISNNLLSCANAFGIKKYVFSSSSTVYGKDCKVPCVETDETAKGGFTNPYAFSKWAIEKILEDICKYDTTFSAISLRYFNPAGHFEVKIGNDDNDEDDEDQRKSFLKDEPTKQGGKNVLPALTESIQTGTPFKIFGVDFETKDGTAERDYIHVSDVADAHVLVLGGDSGGGGGSPSAGYEVFNVGLGVPVSVKKLVETFQKVNSSKVSTLRVVFEDRRPGDLPCVYSDTNKISSKFGGWKPQKGLGEILKF